MKISYTTLSVGLACFGGATLFAETAVFGAAVSDVITLLEDNGGSGTAVNSVTSATLAPYASLWVLNVSNSSHSAIDSSDLSDLSSFVSNGGALIYHDRRVTDADLVLPGANAITFVRDPGVDINLPTPATPFSGSITDTSLDGGNFSTHGYAEVATLPANSTIVLTVAANQAVDFFYPFGNGFVYYSAIPFDHYVGSGGNLGTDLYGPQAVSNLTTLAIPEPSGAPLLMGAGLFLMLLRRRFRG